MRLEYSSSITDETFKELVDFVQWYNRVVGHEPLIVGGWAAWAYHHGLGSKDIDVVFPGAATKNATLLDYFKSHGFRHRKVDFFDYEFYKERRSEKGDLVEVLVDAVSLDRRVQVSGTGIMIPWGLAEKHKRRYSFAGDAVAYIVDPELLLVYKVGALVGRRFKLRTATSDEKIAHYQSKLWKDARDVLGLLQNCAFDAKLLASLLASCGLDSERLDEAKGIAVGQGLSSSELKTFEEKWANIFKPNGKEPVGL